MDPYSRPNSQDSKPPINKRQEIRLKTIFPKKKTYMGEGKTPVFLRHFRRKLGYFGIIFSADEED
jgi:hypothetical protein